MLTYLRVRNLAVIRDVELEFGAGLNALTGETGAGKSILVDAVGLLMGDRADGLQIRHGEERASVEGQFTAADGAIDLLKELGLQGDDSELIIRRELAASSSNRVFINGHLSTLAVLRRIAAVQLALHGQSRHLVLASAESQRRFLDQVALPEELSARLKESWRDLTTAAEERRQYEERLAAGARELDLLTFQINDIEAVAPVAGEDEALRQEERQLSTVHQRARLVNSLLEDMIEGDDALLSSVADMRRRLEDLADLDPAVSGLPERLTSASLEIEEVALELRGAAPGESGDPNRLEEVQSRLLALQGLIRKYGGSLDEVLATLQHLHSGVHELKDADGTSQRLLAREQEAAGNFHSCAVEAGHCRQRTASQLARKAAAEMASLELSGARLEIDAVSAAPEDGTSAELVSRQGGPHGYDQISFRFSAHPGEPARELARVASGGELSRLMLALTLVTGDAGVASGPRTFIFDEVDAGVGGETARAVGERLRQAATAKQVICVTHLPQVAALAARHLHVTKKIEDGRPGTRVEYLTSAARVDELARMLGGGSSLETARGHARALLEAAEVEAAPAARGRRARAGGRRRQVAEGTAS